MPDPEPGRMAGREMPDPEPGRMAGRELPGLELTGLGARWPGAPRNAFSGLSARVRAGEWLTVTGPSGAGKSTLLAVLLGFLPAAAGTLHRGGSLAWCPQQGHLFDSSLRANLLIARPRETPPAEEEMVSALRRVGLGPLLAELRDGLDTRLGPGGASFSGGQRQRIAVARTLLTGAQTILLDEPTAHLDTGSARSLLADLRGGLAGQAVVLVTHDPAAARATDKTLVLA
jgi:ATP-binding cassette subfamily C protein CydCD